MKWVTNNTVTYYKSNNYIYNPTVFLLRFENTLVTTSSSNKRPIDQFDIKSKYKNIGPILKNYSDHKCSIIIIGHISGGDYYIRQHQKRFELFFIDNIVKFGIPILAYFSTTNNHFKLPHDKLFTTINELFTQNDVQIDITKSVYCGNRAGRMDKTISKKSDVDRAFAANVGIKFFVPNVIFEKKPTPDFFWTSEPSMAAKKKLLAFYHQEPPNLVQLFEQKYDDRPIIIMIVGPPCSGKTTLATLIVRDWKENINVLETNYTHKRLPKKQLRELEALIGMGDTIIIDGTNSASQTITEQIEEITKKFDEPMPIEIVNIDLSPRVCTIFNHMKVNMGPPTTQTVKPSTYSAFKRAYQIPKKYTNYKPKLSKIPEYLKRYDNIVFK